MLTVSHYVVDDEETLNQKDLEWMKKNLPTEKLCEETQFKHPKKTAGRKQKVRIFTSNHL